MWRYPGEIRTRLRLSSAFQLHKRPVETTRPNLEKRKDEELVSEAFPAGWGPVLLLLPFPTTLLLLIYGTWPGCLKGKKKKTLVFLIFFFSKSKDFHIILPVRVSSDFVEAEI